MKIAYTGVGSRETPDAMLALMQRIAKALAPVAILRSGGAPGADTAFEQGCLAAGGEMEIYLPWKGFNGNPSPLFGVGAKELEIAAQVHPAWDRLTDGPRKLHARNVRQVLGSSLNAPSSFVVCWTPDGCESSKERKRTTGGTATAIVLAERYDVPVYNLHRAASRRALQQRLATLGVHVEGLAVEDAPVAGQQTLF